MINFPKIGLFAYLTEIRFSTHLYLAEIRFPTVSDNNYIVILQNESFDKVPTVGSCTGCDTNWQRGTNNNKPCSTSMCYPRQAENIDLWTFNMGNIPKHFNLTNVRATAMSSSENLFVKLLPTLRWWHNNTIIATKSIRENSIGLVEAPWIIHFCVHFKFQRLIHGNFQPKVRYNMCIGCNHALVAPVSCMGILWWIQPLFSRCALWEALSKENTQVDVHTRDLTFLG